MTYLNTPIERRILSELPLDSRLRGVSLVQLIARLRQERDLSRAPSAEFALLVIVMAERSPDAALARTIQALALQSHPALVCALIPSTGAERGALSAFVDALPLRPANIQIWPSIGDEQRAQMHRADFVSFLRHGEWLHPSVAAWLATGRAADAPDVVTWCEMEIADGRMKRIQRNPALHPITLLHYPYLRCAFAVASVHAAAYEGDLARECVANDLHLFQIWLSLRTHKWKAHPEFFLLRDHRPDAAKPLSAARRAFAGFELSYAALFGQAKDRYAFIASEAGARAPYRLTPKKQARTISVIIPFRDKPDLTSRALRSLARQSAAARLEVLLIDNQSRADSIASLDTVLSSLPQLRARIVRYDHAFNHSAQCNLGIRESTGDVVVLMNNDAELVAPSAIEEMAAWALEPNLASVGAALRDPLSGKVETGFATRLPPSPYHESIVEHGADALAPFVRETFGNSFALAALPRAIFDRAGALDEIRFPNGLNDVEFACRTRARGFTHIVLGHVEARHAPGASRARADETPQMLLLRARYPEAAAAAFLDLKMQDAVSLRAEAETHFMRTPAQTALGIEPRRTLLQRTAGRLAETRFVQAILRNPKAYRAFRGLWRRVRGF